MNILLITISWPKYGEYNLYSDLAQEFVENGNYVAVAAINEKGNHKQPYRSKNKKSQLLFENGLNILDIRAGNIQKRNKYLKVISSFLAGPKLVFQVYHYFRNEQFDLILFPTPPITLIPGIKIIKKMYHAKLYLLLKDIWPQDAVDLGAMRQGGIVWKVFRFLEKMTYKCADYIGCMSPANIKYIASHNPYVNEKILEVCPNSEKIRNIELVERDTLRNQYSLPKDKIIFVYGGNLGIAQGVHFLIDIITTYEKMEQYYFLIIGAGTEYQWLYNEIHNRSFQNVKIISWISKSEFIKVVKACDIGLILLNRNSTVPNFPSRLLTYLTAKIPIIAAVDEATDIGEIIEDAKCGYQALNGDMESFDAAVKKMISDEISREIMGENGYKLYLEKYTTKKSYEIIMSHFNTENSNENQENSILAVKKKGEALKSIKRFLLTHIYDLINFICYGDLPTSYYLKRGMKIGKNFHRQSSTKFDPTHCFLIRIGDDVTVANHVQFLAHDYSPRMYLGYGKVGKINIGNHVFIGAGTIILPNVTIGNDVIIGSGSIVTKSIPPNTIVAGAPAKAIGSTNDYIAKCKDQLLSANKLDSTYGDYKKITRKMKNDIINASQDGFAFIELGKVVDYGKRKEYH